MVRFPSGLAFGCPACTVVMSSQNFKIYSTAGYMVETKVYFIGAGPGDPELLTVKGQRLISEADLVLYAGSLVLPSRGRSQGRGEVADSAPEP